MDMQKGETEKLNEEESFNDKHFEVVFASGFEYLSQFCKVFKYFLLKIKLILTVLGD